MDDGVDVPWDRDLEMFSTVETLLGTKCQWSPRY